MIEIHKIHELLTRVPQPPKEALPHGASDPDCDAFEHRTGIRLPEAVRQWLKLTNGPCVGPGGLYGIRPQRSHLDMEMYLKMFPSWKTRNWIPVAGDGCGNYYLIPTQAEYGAGFPVLFVETSFSSDEPAFVVASNFERFLIFLLEKELGAQGWPYHKAYVTKIDPEITRYTGIPMPWTPN